MATYSLFPGITPNSDENHIPRYREMDWDQLRTYTSTVQGVSAKQKMPEIIADLDEHFGVDLEGYAREAWDMTKEEYEKEIK